MPETRKPTPPFIVSLVSHPEPIGPAVEEALHRNGNGYDFSECIDFSRTLDRGPLWYKGLRGLPMLELHKLSNGTLWREVIIRSGFNLSEIKPPVIRQSTIVDLDYAAYSISNKGRNGFGSLLPLFGLAAMIGSDLPKFLTEKAAESPVTGAAIAAGNRFISPSVSAEEFLGRMKLLFPPRIRPGDESAFSDLISSGSFIGNSGVCPAISLTRKILEAFGQELEAGFDRKLVEPPVFNEALLL